MCGRFTQKSERPEITEEFYLKGLFDDYKPSYNVAPSQNAGIVKLQDGEQRILKNTI
jgi:putative SOS response-associated peptidase YedK